MSVLFALLSSLSNACTAVLQRQATATRPARVVSGWHIARYLVRDRRWLLGMAFMAATFVFSAVALYFGQLAVVQPLLVTELIFTLALRRLWLGDHIDRRIWLAALMICVGLAGFLLAAQPHPGLRSPTVAAWVWVLVSRGAVVTILVLVGRTGSPTRRAASLGVAAAIVWAVDAAFVKATTDLLAHHGWSSLLVHWPLYSIVITGVLGTVLLQAAFAAGPLTASQPALLIVDPLASIALGVQLFGEHLNTSALALVGSSLGLVLTFAGVVLISVWAPPVRGGTPARPLAPVSGLG